MLIVLSGTVECGDDLLLVKTPALEMEPVDDKIRKVLSGVCVHWNRGDYNGCGCEAGPAEPNPGNAIPYEPLIQR
jgi:hypothetical protein